jgi:hypothetical protein
MLVILIVLKIIILIIQIIVFWILIIIKIILFIRIIIKIILILIILIIITKCKVINMSNVRNLFFKTKCEEKKKLKKYHKKIKIRKTNCDK